MDLKNARQEDCKMKAYEHYITLADLFRYPGEDFPARVAACASLLTEKYPEAAKELQPFLNYIAGCDADRREELFTKTFDVQPICYLDLGYVIFGEDYKRGAFLLHMQEEQGTIGNDCGTDLPDNLCNMLSLFTRSENQSLLDDLAINIMIPGLKKMVGEFDSARIELKQKVLRKLHKALITEELNQGNVYRNALTALLMVFEEDFRNRTSFEINEESQFRMESTTSFFRKRTDIEMENNFKLD